MYPNLIKFVINSLGMTGILLAVAVALLPLPALALSSNSDEPIHIKADKAVLNESDGTALYEGDVVISQGGATMTADSVIIYSKDQALIKIVASGNPAQLSQKTDGDKPETQAFGQKITYLHEEGTVKIENQAKLIQGQNQFQGKIITFNSRTRIVSASGSGSSEDKDGRVELIIHPQKLPQKNSQENKPAQQNNAENGE